MRKTDRIVFDSLAEEMMAKSNVFGSFVMDRIFWRAQWYQRCC